MLPAIPPFDRIGIVGLGLVGGSIALAVRRTWPGVVLTGVDRPDILDTAMRRAVINERRGSIRELGDVDLIVLAAPVPDIVALLGEAAGAQLPAVITDVGSTKRRIMDAAEAVPSFVGGHPMSGGERGGLANARADLFAGRPWLLVPRDDTAPAAMARLERLVESLGGVPRRIEADTHDRVMAYVSHVPQLLSSALMASAAEAVGGEGLALSGRGFADLTRLASSPADIWEGILSTNSDFIAEALRALLVALPTTPVDLDDQARLNLLFARAGAWRDLLAAARPSVD